MSNLKLTIKQRKLRWLGLLKEKNLQGNKVGRPNSRGRENSKINLKRRHQILSEALKIAASKLMEDLVHGLRST